nr:SBBP repeat-containing protein [Micromonospora sp. DSM 115978]
MRRSWGMAGTRSIIATGAVLALVGVAAMARIGVGSNTWQPENSAPRTSSGQAPQQVANMYARLPLTFVENQGQADDRVRFLSHGTRYGFFFTPDSLAMSLLEQDGATGVNLFLDFVGANPDVSVGVADQAPGTVSYLSTQSSAGAHGGLPTYGEVVYRELWSGVDMAINGRDGVLKYEFRVAAGADVDDIRLAYRGADGLTTDEAGSLMVDTAVGALRDNPPVSYQLVHGKRVPVESRYLLGGADAGNRSYGFAVDGYDPARELVIDPGLEYSTFLGGFGNQAGTAIAVDAAGSAYVTGRTQSPTFPTTAGAFDRTGSVNSDLDAFVAKLNPAGTGLVYSTFLGGSNFDWGRDLAIDAAGNAYVTGQTKSSNFPTTNGAYDRTFNVGTCPRCGIDQYDAFLTKLNPSGSQLVYSTFLGGTDLDDSLAITLDGAGQAYVTGQTASSDFPTTTGAFDTTANGEYDMFVAKVNAQGSQLIYSTRVGGADNELPGGIDVDASGSVVVGGATRSTGFPTTPDAIQPTHSGGNYVDLFEGFVTKLNPTGTALVYSTFLGGIRRDSVSDVLVDAVGNTYLSGSTLSPEFPTTPGAFDTTLASAGESFAAKLDPTGSALLYSTFLGGASASLGALAGDGGVWLAGTAGPSAVVTPDAASGQFGGGSWDAYLARLNPGGTALDYATFIGGSDSEGAADLALDPAGAVYLTGSTRSANFPTTAGAFDRGYGGDPYLYGADAWVAKVSIGQE